MAELQNNNKNLEEKNDDYKTRIKETEKLIAEQQSIRSAYLERLKEKRDKYQIYMNHLKNEKDNQIKKRQALKLNLEKIYNMQKELSIFLKLTKAKYTNGLQFLDVLKDIDGKSGKEKKSKSHSFTFSLIQ